MSSTKERMEEVREVWKQRAEFRKNYDPIVIRETIEKVREKYKYVIADYILEEIIKELERELIRLQRADLDDKIEQFEIELKRIKGV